MKCCGDVHAKWLSMSRSMGIDRYRKSTLSFNWRFRSNRSPASPARYSLRNTSAVRELAPFVPSSADMKASGKPALDHGVCQKMKQDVNGWCAAGFSSATHHCSASHTCPSIALPSAPRPARKPTCQCRATPPHLFLRDRSLQVRLCHASGSPHHVDHALILVIHSADCRRYRTCRGSDQPCATVHYWSGTATALPALPLVQHMCFVSQCAR